MRTIAVSLFIAAALLGSCSRAPVQRPAAAVVPVAVTGQSCIELTRIREARVIDDGTIDFHLRDGTLLRNTLDNRCPTLGFERAFTYATSLSRLCSTDIITVIQQSGRGTGPSCGLGPFVAQAAIPVAR